MNETLFDEAREYIIQRHPTASPDFVDRWAGYLVDFALHNTALRLLVEVGRAGKSLQDELRKPASGAIGYNEDTGHPLNNHGLARQRFDRVYAAAMNNNDVASLLKEMDNDGS